MKRKFPISGYKRHKTFLPMKSCTNLRPRDVQSELFCLQAGSDSEVLVLKIKGKFQ